MEGASDYLKREAGRLGMDREQALAAAQSLLDTLYPRQTRALSLNDGILKVVTPSAPVASELRLGQVELLRKLAIALPAHTVTKLHIQIRAL